MRINFQWNTFKQLITQVKPKTREYENEFPQEYIQATITLVKPKSREYENEFPMEFILIFFNRLEQLFF
jgi:hypothetical protein